MSEYAPTVITLAPINGSQYVGRWLSAIDETHKDGSFPGTLCFE